MSSIRFIVIWNLFIDINFFIYVYKFAILPENRERYDYKIVSMITFMCITAPYWITYSALITIRHNQGSYEPSKLKNNKWLKFLSKVVFLTFVGPLTTLVSQTILGCGDVLTLLVAAIICVPLEHVKVIKRKAE
jgi:hypothetical protein